MLRSSTKSSRFLVYNVAPMDRALNANKQSLSKLGSLVLRSDRERRQDFCQYRSCILPLTMTGSNNSTNSFERPNQCFDAPSSGRRVGACQEFFSYDRTEVDARSFVIVQLPNDRQCASTLD